MDQNDWIPLKDVYSALAKNNITVEEIHDFVRILSQIGYTPDLQFAKESLYPRKFIAIILAAQRLYLNAQYSKDEALMFAVESQNFESPQRYAQQKTSRTIPLNFIDYVFAYHEKKVVAFFLTASCVGMLAGLTTLLFPQHGFMNIEQVLGSVSVLTNTR